MSKKSLSECNSQMGNGKIENCPMVSIITLNYNSPYLFETINSVLAQNYVCIQYILLDDGSDLFCTKEIEQYIETHKMANLTDYIILENEKNVGTVKSINRALRYASGKYVFYLACDDVFYHNSIIGLWVDEFKRSNASVITALYSVQNHDFTQEINVLPSDKHRHLLEQGDIYEIWNELLNANFIFGASTAFRKMVFEEHGYYDESYKLIEDYPFNLKLCREGVSFHLWDQKAIKYRTGGISSPGKLNWNYIKDTKKILYREILPYTKKPLKAIGYNNMWICAQVLRKMKYKLKL